MMYHLFLMSTEGWLKIAETTSKALCDDWVQFSAFNACIITTTLQEDDG